MSLDIFFNGHLEAVVAQCHWAEMLPVDLAELGHGEPGRIRRVSVAVIGIGLFIAWARVTVVVLLSFTGVSVRYLTSPFSSTKSVFR
jgi:hypothetical protein